MSRTWSNRLFGAGICVVGLIVEKTLTGERLALAQMILWTVVVFGFVGSYVYKSLRRARECYVAFTLIVLHFIGLVRFRSYFPWQNVLAGIFGMMAEAMILGILYARISQSVDPDGPFGLTEAEIQARKMKRSLR